MSGEGAAILAFDLPGGLHFLSNSTNQIISTVIYKQWKTVFLKKKFVDVFSYFTKKTIEIFMEVRPLQIQMPKSQRLDHVVLFDRHTFV